MPLYFCSQNEAYGANHYSQALLGEKWSGREDSNLRPTVPKIVPERFIDGQELHKPCILDYIPFMLFLYNHQLHGHVLPLSYHLE